MNFLITGGSGALGRALVLDALERGHNVAFTYHSNAESAAEISAEAARIAGAGVCRSYLLDQRDSASVDKVCSEVVNDFADVHVLVNNAAIERSKLAISVDDQEWNDILSTNLSGPFFLSRQLLPHFLGQGYGRFIHISSVTMRGANGQVCYASSKAGLIGLSGTLAREYGRRGITSNVLVLGFMEGGMTRQIATGDASEGLLELARFWREACPIGREGRFAEIVGLVAYLASNKASFINGQAISATGGLDWLP
jgi:3-oxoacyl-[acyl-carrier protein] reductase